MKKLIALTIIILSVVNAWEIQKTIESEGTQTNVIKCENGSIKAVYYSSKSGKYEITPTIKFDTLDDASKYVCGEWSKL